MDNPVRHASNFVIVIPRQFRSGTNGAVKKPKKPFNLGHNINTKGSDIAGTTIIDALDCKVWKKQPCNSAAVSKEVFYDT